MTETTAKMQTAVTMNEGVPAGFVFPSLEEMTKNGPVRCEHPCDVEHIQAVDGMDWATSILWTTDAGVGVFDEIVGCQWVGLIEREQENPGTWDTGWGAVVEVMLDCDSDTPVEDAIAIVHQLLAETVAGNVE